MSYSELVKQLRTRAEIRRKATCRGVDDRLANELDQAATAIEELLDQLWEAHDNYRD